MLLLLLLLLLLAPVLFLQAFCTINYARNPARLIAAERNFHPSEGAENVVDNILSFASPRIHSLYQHLFEEVRCLSLSLTRRRDRTLARSASAEHRKVFGRRDRKAPRVVSHTSYSPCNIPYQGWRVIYPHIKFIAAFGVIVRSCAP